MTDSKRKKQLIVLSGLLVILLGSLYYALRGTSVSPEVPPATAPQTSTSVGNTDGLIIERARGSGKKTISLSQADPAIHLEKLHQFTPGSPVNARNMFSMEAAPPPVKAGKMTPSRQGPAGNPLQAPSEAGGPAASVPSVPSALPLNLRFYGIKIDPASKGRQGFFTEGNETFLAGEGDLVANRYRVMKITESSAEIEDLSSKSRRQLPMSAQ